MFYIDYVHMFIKADLPVLCSIFQMKIKVLAEQTKVKCAAISRNVGVK